MHGIMIRKKKVSEVERTLQKKSMGIQRWLSI
jgi:hypothetical protein